VRLNSTSQSDLFTYAQSELTDLRFEDSLGNELWYDMERWTDATNPDSAEFWVLVPTVFGKSSGAHESDSTRIRMHWGHSPTSAKDSSEMVSECGTSRRLPTALLRK
jgi:hypothetical protein